MCLYVFEYDESYFTCLVQLYEFFMNIAPENVMVTSENKYVKQTTHSLFALINFISKS